MQTTINNNLRVFQIITSLGHQYFCNLQDIEKIVVENELKAGYYKIYHFWDNKAKQVSKKYLFEMLQSNNLKQNFHY